MKQECGMYFCFFLLALTTTVSHRALLQKLIVASTGLFLPRNISNNIQNMCLYVSHHRPYELVLHQFQLICFYSLSARTRLQHHNMRRCRQCTSLFKFSHHLLQLLMVCFLKSIILHKKWEGRKNSMCHKNTKKSSFTPAIGTHPHITSMIDINS